MSLLNTKPLKPNIPLEMTPFRIGMNSPAYMAIPIDKNKSVSENFLFCDPLTGLVAYPCFENFMVNHRFSKPSKNNLNLAIGDVDDLSEYVLSKNINNPNCFGHLAGNACMKEIGRIVKEWSIKNLNECDFFLCGTFGGDEIIIACSGISLQDFTKKIKKLSIDIKSHAPRPCSFSVSATKILKQYARNDKKLKYENFIAFVDKNLFQLKKLKKQGIYGDGFVESLGLFDLERKSD